MTASMAQPVLAADSKTTLDVIISQYGTQTQAWWTQFEKDFEAENPDIDLNLEVISWIFWEKREYINGKKQK